MIMNTTTHSATVRHYSDRVFGTNNKTGQNTKTIAWSTRCTCGHVIETKSNSRASHIAKVAKHTSAGINS